jgi:hypothetical protein
MEPEFKSKESKSKLMLLTTNQELIVNECVIEIVWLSTLKLEKNPAGFYFSLSH